MLVFLILVSFAVYAVFGNARRATFPTGVSVFILSAFHYLQGHASTFVEQPIGTPSLSNNPDWTKSVFADRV